MKKSGARRARYAYPALLLAACCSAAPEVGVEIVAEGRGAVIADGDRVQVCYRGYLEGRKRPFEDNWSRGVTIVVGESPVMPGWHEGLRGLRVGGQARLHIPAALGYGERGNPPLVPPNADLLFEVRVEEAR